MDIIFSRIKLHKRERLLSCGSYLDHFVAVEVVAGDVAGVYHSPCLFPDPLTERLESKKDQVIIN